MNRRTFWLVSLTMPFLCGCGQKPTAPPATPTVTLPEEPTLRATLKGHAGIVTSVAFSGDGKTLASGSIDMTVRLWDVATGKEKAMLGPNTREMGSTPRGVPPVDSSEGHIRPVWSVAFTRDGKTLASGSEDRTVKLWDVATGKEKATLRGMRGMLSVAFCSDGNTLASASAGAVILWDVVTGKDKATFKHTERFMVTSVALSGDGKLLASASNADDPTPFRGTVKLWDVATGKEKITHKAHTSEVSSVAFSGDGKTLASGSLDGTVKLWDVASDKEKATFMQQQNGHPIAVNSVAFTGDGKLLASASRGHSTVKLWDVATGKEKATLKGQGVWLPSSLAFSGDGKLLAVAGHANEQNTSAAVVYLWDIPSAK